MAYTKGSSPPHSVSLLHTSFLFSPNVYSCDPSVPEPPTEYWHFYALVTPTAEQSGEPFHPRAYHLPNIRLHKITTSQAYNIKPTHTTHAKLI